MSEHADIVALPADETVAMHLAHAMPAYFTSRGAAGLSHLN
jgi:hypothetical protein